LNLLSSRRIHAEFTQNSRRIHAVFTPKTLKLWHNRGEGNLSSEEAAVKESLKCEERRREGEKNTKTTRI